MEYFNIKFFRNKHYSKRCLQVLKSLRKGIDKEIPHRKLNKKLIFGTWNIREFDGNRKKFGPRKEDDFLYIAEIISRFDLLAIQEINDDLNPLRKVMKILGKNYEYIVTDVAAWKNGGNNERLGFIYDKRTVKFDSVAGELVLPQDMLIRNNNGNIERQFARTPFMCSFQSGWFKFKVTTVHVYFGEDSEKSNKFKRRIDEIDRVAKMISDNAKKEETRSNSNDGWHNPYNYFIVGDFNIVDDNNVTYDALEKHGFKTVKNIKGSNKDRTKFYDQISYYKTSDLDFDWKESKKSKGKAKNNVDRTFDFFKYVYTKKQFPLFEDDIKKYVKKNKTSFTKAISKLESKINEIDVELADTTISNSRRKTLKKRKSKTEEDISYNKNLIAFDSEALEKFYKNSPWKTFQISDHLPLWVEIDIDKSEEYLDSLMK